MRLLLVFARAYPRRSLAVVGCMLLAALAEGVGLTTLLPVLGMATRPGLDAAPGAPVESGLERTITQGLAALGLAPELGVLLSIFVAAMALKAVLVLLSKKQIGYTVAHVATDLRLALLRAVLAARWSFFIRQPLGAVANAFASEAGRAAAAYVHGTAIVSLLIQTLLYTAIALALSWQGTLGAIAVGSLSLLALNGLVRATRRAGARQTRLLHSVLRRLADSLQAIKPLKAMARETLVGPVLEQETRRLNRALERQVLSKEAMGAIQEPLIVGCLALGIYVAVALWHLSLASVLLLLVLFARTLGCLGKAQRQYQNLAGVESAYWSLQDRIDGARAEREADGGTRAPTFVREIALEGVDFAHAELPVLRDVSLVIPAGRITALVGPSGAGKTTIADLIVGLCQPDAGSVRIDGVPLSEISLKAWRSMIGYVPQETLLLHDTVSMNVALGDPHFTPRDVESALRRAGAWEFVSQLPDGPETVVEERGARLSGGQRQRIVIARALVHQPRLLILDEATTALDPQTEASVWNALLRLRGETAILAISHQPQLAALADRVYSIEDNRARRIHPGQAPVAPTWEVA